MVSVPNETTLSKASPTAPPGLQVEAAAMLDDPAFPFVVKADVGRLSDGSIGLRLTVAASEEAYQCRAWTQVAYLLEPATARELATNLAWR